MRAKLTYKVKHWSGGAVAAPLPALRAKHGDDVATIVEIFAEMFRERRDQPTSQDIKRTLRAIIHASRLGVLDRLDAGTEGVLDRLDAGTEGVLLREAWTHYREVVGLAVEMERLSSDALVHCATQALRRASRGDGRPKTDNLAVALVGQLLQVCGKALPTDDRYALITDALQACGLKHSDDTVRRLILKARQVS